ncbi:hypothetical protein SOVF_026970, partial [Spinacia oleracea]
MVPRRVPTFDGNGWRFLDRAFRPEFHLSQRPRAGFADGEPLRTFWLLRDLYDVFPAVYDKAEARAIWLQTGLDLTDAFACFLKIWMYEHFLTLALARTGVVAYPYATSWVGAVRNRVSLATFQRALRVLPVDQDAMEAGGDDACLRWENFVDRRGNLEGLLVRLSPPVRFVLPEEEIDPKDIPYADRVIRYVDSDGEQVEVTVPVAFPPHWRSYDAILDHYAVAPRVRVRRWILVIDSLKRHCANLTNKLTGRDIEVHSLAVKL